MAGYIHVGTRQLSFGVDTFPWLPDLMLVTFLQADGDVLDWIYRLTPTMAKSSRPLGDRGLARYWSGEDARYIAALLYAECYAGATLPGADDDDYDDSHFQTRSEAP